MKSSKNILILIGLFVLALVVFYTMRGDETITYSVNVEASTDKQKYSSGEEVTLTIDITNTGDLAACISDTSQGNITFLSITRDGQAVDSRTVHADALETEPRDSLSEYRYRLS